MTNHHIKLGDIVEVLVHFPYLVDKSRGLVHRLTKSKEGNKLLEVRIPKKFWKYDVSMDTRTKGNLLIVTEDEIRKLL